jgi:hypothetical protein
LIIEPFWKLKGIFRDELAVDALNGYDFRPAELRRLFRAGAESVRIQCLEVARLIGILGEPGAGPTCPGGSSYADLEAKVIRWCSPELPKHDQICPEGPPEEPKLRRCGEEPPCKLHACNEQARMKCEAEQ